MSAAAVAPYVQGTFDELGTPLRETTFVVVDLETTGGSPETCRITEIGAVKVRGGEVLGEFATLVRPGMPIPPFIAVLTGITDAMVAGAPDIRQTLPAFLEFAHGSVLVAHNAPFDVGFLRAAAVATGHAWPSFPVVDTARLARRVLTRDDSPNCKLSSLARVFHSPVTPDHRALTDARATVHVLHGLLERLGNLGVHSLDELTTFSSQVSAAQRRKRYLAETLPHAPGVYEFLDAAGRVLYVGKSKDLRSRVRSYFTASEMRSRMAEMVGLAERVVPVVCATNLEAEVRELRLIAEHKPRYNRRSRFPERAVWVRLTDEPFPRLSIVRAAREDGVTYLGPFASRRVAEQAVAAVHEAFPLRQCSGRLSPRRTSPACVLAGIGRCGAPCEGGESLAEYAVHVAAARGAIDDDPRALIAASARRIAGLVAAERYEDAGAQRDRVQAFVRTAARLQRLSALTRCALMVAARPTDDLGWELVAVRHGRLAGTSVAPRGAHPGPYVEALLATMEHVTPTAGPLAAAGAEETERILRWLEAPGTRLVELDGTWACPAYGAGGLTEWLPAGVTRRESRWSAEAPSHDTRGLRPVSRPAR